MTTKTSKQRVARTRAAGKWTEARYWSFIRSALRGASMRYPSKYAALANAKRLRPRGAAGKHTFEYQCAECKGWFEAKNVAVDHIVPAGSLKAYSDLPGFVERLFCEPENLQVLCTVDHAWKTAAERAARKKEAT